MKVFIRVINIIVLCAVPFLVIVYQHYTTKIIYSSDPDYAYIMNGLNLDMFKLPLYSDHPGVPLTMLSAIGLQIIYWFSGHTLDIQTDVLTDPAYYEVRLQMSLFVLILLMVFLTGFFILKKTKFKKK